MIKIPMPYSWLQGYLSEYLEPGGAVDRSGGGFGGRRGGAGTSPLLLAMMFKLEMYFEINP